MRGNDSEDYSGVFEENSARWCHIGSQAWQGLGTYITFYTGNLGDTFHKGPNSNPIVLSSLTTLFHAYNSKLL